jgi:SAM-dependent methyltransferase
MAAISVRSEPASSVERPVYPTWIRSSRTVTFWLLAVGIVVLAIALAPVWRPAPAIALLAAPFLYIAGVLTLTAHRLGPRGGDVQGAIHQLVVETVGSKGRLLDVGCGSGQLLIRLAKSAPGDYVGIDFWGSDWHYSQSRAERNAALEGVQVVEFGRGSASKLRFADGEFGRVVSCLTFHEVRDVEDKTVSIAEALRVLEAGGRFAFVDLFDDPGFYRGRGEVVKAIESAGGRIDSCRRLSECLDLRFPLNLAKVLKYAVLVSGNKAHPNLQHEPPCSGRTLSI